MAASDLFFKGMCSCGAAYGLYSIIGALRGTRKVYVTQLVDEDEEMPINALDNFLWLRGCAGVSLLSWASLSYVAGPRNVEMLAINVAAHSSMLALAAWRHNKAKRHNDQTIGPLLFREVYPVSLTFLIGFCFLWAKARQ